MGTFEYGTDQAAFDAAFGGIGLDEAVAIILGDMELSLDQRDALRLASGNGGYRLLFVPEPVGHVGFQAAATKGCGNRGWLRLVPATPECRRRVNAQRRVRWAEALGLPFETANRIFSACRGHEPTLWAAAEMRAAAPGIKGLSDRAWRDMGFRPGHPIEGAALKALRDSGLA